MIGFNRIQRYILREYFASFLLVLGTVSVAILLVDTVEQLRTIGARTDLSIGYGVYLALLKFPMLAEQTMPFAVLIGSMMTFRRLSRRAELPVIRASGLSAWTFLTPPLLAAAIIGVVTMTVISPIGANLNAVFEATRTRLFDGNAAKVTVFESGIWLREQTDTGQIIIHAESIDETGSILSNTKFIVENRLLGEQGETERYVFANRYDAETAQLIGGFWQLQTVIENTPDLDPRRYDTLSLATQLDLTTLTDQFAEPSSVSFWTLPEHIKRTRQAGLRTSELETRLMVLFALPLTFMAMSLVGAIACLRLARLGGAVQLMGLAGLGAVAFYFANQFSTSLAASGAIPTLVGAWLPSVLCVLICLLILAYREDG